MSSGGPYGRNPTPRRILPPSGSNASSYQVLEATVTTSKLRSPSLHSRAVGRVQLGRLRAPSLLQYRKWDRTERHASWPGDFAVVLGGSPCCCCCCCRCNVVSLVIADSVLLIYSLLARNKNQRPFFSRAWMREDADAQQRPMRCFHVWVVATLPADAMG